MIANFPTLNTTVFLEITAPTFIRGQFVEAGEIVEVSPEDAENITTAGRGRIAVPADPAEIAEAVDAAADAPAESSTPSPRKRK